VPRPASSVIVRAHRANPTFLTNLAEGTRIVDEEQFGPALPILTYRTVPEAIHRGVNTHMQLTHDAPFTGMKHSGLGSEMGLWSIYAYTDPQAVFRTRSQVIKKGAGQAAGA
jgi:acyl-CoA reductase-like NAD-dependent aldehyde dehydrogenase